MAQDWNEWITALYDKKYKRLYRVAYRLTGNSETAKELAQDTFLWAVLRREDLLVHPKPEAWLTRTLINLVKNENRRLSSMDVSLETQFNVPAPEVERGLSELLPQKLSKEDQEVLIWRFEQGLDYKEIANRLGISETGSRSRVFRALEKCRKLLGDNGSHT